MKAIKMILEHNTNIMGSVKGIIFKNFRKSSKLFGTILSILNQGLIWEVQLNSSTRLQQQTAPLKHVYNWIKNWPPGGLGCLFDFTSFSPRPVLVLGCPFLTPGSFLIRFHFFFIENCSSYRKWGKIRWAKLSLFLWILRVPQKFFHELLAIGK